MHRIEDELKAALARREPPAGFADRVMERILAGRPRRSSIPHSWMAAAAALLIAMLGGGAYEYQRAERIRLQGERAKAELVFALELASQKLHTAKSKVLKVSQDRI